jgi:hypothetical protein
MKTHRQDQFFEISKTFPRRYEKRWRFGLNRMATIRGRQRGSELSGRFRFQGCDRTLDRRRKGIFRIEMKTLFPGKRLNSSPLISF